MNTAPSIHPRRSALFVPAARPRALAKARTAGADVLIFDLEDSAGPDEKRTARERLAAWLHEGGAWPEVERLVRVNALDAPGAADDLAAIAGAPIDGVVLPKVEDPRVVRGAEATLARLGAPDALRLWPMIETPRGVLAAEAIAAASPRVDALVLGANDLLAALDADPAAEREALLYARSHLVMVARAFGLTPLDAVYVRLDDPEGFAASSRASRALGFAGRTIIHPSMVAPANEAYGPTPAALADARALVEAWGARPAGVGVVRVGERMVEALHVDAAARLLAYADALARRSAARSAASAPEGA